MKNILRFVPIAVFFIAISIVYGAVPALNVTVSDASGKAAFRGATNADGTFATTNLKPGNYVVQFHSTNPALKGNQYALVISAGKKKVSANSVTGETFAAGGVAMKIDVGASVKITGQVAVESKVAKSTLSHHFKVLREAGITHTRANGTHRLMSLRKDDLDERFPGLISSVIDAVRVT